MLISKRSISPVIVIIQARMGSTRLPGKVMKEICGKPILWHVINRVSAAKLVDKVVVATTEDPSDDVIEKWCDANHVDSFRGSSLDVLDRYYNAAKTFYAKTVVRVTSDCPLIDPMLIDKIIERFSEGCYDHVSVDSSYPDGLDAEVFPMDVLKKAHNEARLSSEREHVTPYIWKNPRKFRLSKLRSDIDLSHLRWTVDDAKDFRLVTEIYEALDIEGRLFYTDDILRLLEERPELSSINSDTMRNEGYAKSLREDKVVNN